MAKEKILVVDDEKNIVELVKYNLNKEGYDVICAYDGFEAVNLTRQESPDLIILDIMLPGQSGMDVCRILRKETRTPIIMATAKGEEIDKILGLEMGADDYVTKPFSPRELVARVKAVLRRTSSRGEEKDEVSFDDLTINLIKHEVRKGGEEVDLKPKEFDLLRLLATNPGKVFTRDFLLEQLWGYDYLGDTRTVDVHMRRLRQKIEVDAASPCYLKTVHGIGYKFQHEEKE
ncbi:MAG: response regulator transcription factor [Chloroflexi bacterium]|nr:response regulator transcription factor [Chloroflexota bacterium]